MAETLQEYLVSLGWDIDQLSFGNAMGVLNQFEGGANAMGKSVVTNTAKSTVAVVTLFATLQAGVAKFLTSTAQADLEVERFARRMFTSEQSARSFTAALDAMGASYDDIFYMTPEEYQGFMELNNLGKQLEAPKELQEDLKLIRDIQFEFSKLKMLANYGTQWVAYYFIEHFKIPLKEGESALESLNNYIIKHMPQISKKVADFMIKITDMGIAGVRVFNLLKDGVIAVADIFPPSMLKVAGALAAITALVMTNPLMAFLIGLFMLLEDFAVYKAGGKTAFAGIWEMFDKVGEQVDTSGLDRIKDSLDDVWGSANNLWLKFDELITKILNLGEQYGAIEFIAGEINILLDTTAYLLESLAKGLEMIDNFSLVNLKDGFSKRWDIFWDENGWRSGNYDRYAELYGQDYSQDLLPDNTKNTIHTNNMMNTNNNQKTNTTVSNNQNNNINIYESQNPRETANEVYDRLFTMRSFSTPMG